MEVYIFPKIKEVVSAVISLNMFSMSINSFCCPLGILKMWMFVSLLISLGTFFVWGYYFERPVFNTNILLSTWSSLFFGFQMYFYLIYWSLHFQDFCLFLLQNLELFAEFPVHILHCLPNFVIQSTSVLSWISLSSL
jgi:hypothetical protein